MTLVKMESEAADDRTIEAMPRPMRPTIARSMPLSNEYAKYAGLGEGNLARVAREYESPEKIGGEGSTSPRTSPTPPTTMALAVSTIPGRGIAARVERIWPVLYSELKRARRARP